MLCPPKRGQLTAERRELPLDRRTINCKFESPFVGTKPHSQNIHRSRRQQRNNR